MNHDSNQCPECISGLTECHFDPRQRAAEAEQRAFEAWDGGYPAAECFDMGPDEPVLEVVPETVESYTGRTVDGVSIRADGSANPTAAQLGLNAYTERALRGVDALIWGAEVPL